MLNKSRMGVFMLKKHRILTTVAAIAIAAEMVTAAFAVSGGIEWELDTGTLTIRKGSGTGEMPDYNTASSVPWYSNLSFITALVIESGVTSIGAQAFYNCIGLNKVINFAITPQAISANVFLGIAITNVKLYVPAEALEAYRAADVWKYFNIAVIDGETPIRDIPTKSDGRTGIMLSESVASDKVQMTMKLANNERVTETKVVIYDVVGNAVFEAATRDDKLVWNLCNSTGRNVANGSYQIVAQVRGMSVKTYIYSAKLGVRR